MHTGNPERGCQAQARRSLAYASMLGIFLVLAGTSLHAAQPAARARPGPPDVAPLSEDAVDDMRDIDGRVVSDSRATQALAPAEASTASVAPASADAPAGEQALPADQNDVIVSVVPDDGRVDATAGGVAPAPSSAAPSSTVTAPFQAPAESAAPAASAAMPFPNPLADNTAVSPSGAQAKHESLLHLYGGTLWMALAMSAACLLLAALPLLRPRRRRLTRTGKAPVLPADVSDTATRNIAEADDRLPLHDQWTGELTDMRADRPHAPDEIPTVEQGAEATQTDEAGQPASTSPMSVQWVAVRAQTAPFVYADALMQPVRIAQPSTTNGDVAVEDAPPMATMADPERKPPPDSSTTFAQETMQSLARDLRQVRLLSGQHELEPALSVIDVHLRQLQRGPSAGLRHDTGPAPEMADIEQRRAAQREVTAMRADMRVRLARRSGKVEDFAQAVQAWEACLTHAPGDAESVLQLGQCLLEQANAEQEELAKASLWQRSAEVLAQAVDAMEAPSRASLSLLGEALCRHATSGMGVNESVLTQAENILRHAIDGEDADDSQAAWWLQTALAVQLPGKDAAALLARLHESIVLLRRGVNASGSSPERVRWQSALLRAELEEVLRAPVGAASRRLRLIDLHAHYAPRMQGEDAPEVLAAWIDLLCASARASTGGAAMKRYQEIDDVLARLLSSDPDGHGYKASWMDMLHSRLPLENDEGKRNLLSRTKHLLAGRREAPAPLRLETSKLALMCAALEQDTHARQQAYLRALELARPLTAVPSVAVPALQCALKALLAMRENKERRVYARCLQMMMPTDGLSLALLAESAYQDDMPADACRYLEQAIRAPGTRLPDPMQDLWQEASLRWGEQGGRDDEWQRNRRQLRLVAGIS